MPDILFLGSMYPRNEIDKIRRNSRAGIQTAADILQWDYVEGVEANTGTPVKIITRMNLGIFPLRYNRLWVKGHTFSHRSGAEDYAVGFWNTAPIRPFFFYRVGEKQTVKWAKKKMGEQKILIAYSYAMAGILEKVKLVNPNVKTILVVLDLPRFTDMAHNSSLIYRVKHQMEEKRMSHALAYVDLLVPITQQMRDEIDPQHRIRAVVIDGMVKKRETVKRREAGPQNNFTIVYTGTLTKAYGITDMLEAVEMLKNLPIRLVICGKGEAEPEIRKAAASNPNIEYRGLVSSEEAYQLQCDADLLLNPRKNEGEYTSFSFPSKILQYMSSGTPVLCYKLDGMDEKYGEYLFFVRRDETLADAIHRVYRMERTQLRSIGENARKYVEREKTSEAQTKKILVEVL